MCLVYIPCCDKSSDNWTQASFAVNFNQRINRKTDLILTKLKLKNVNNDFKNHTNFYIMSEKNSFPLVESELEEKRMSSAR